MTLAKGWAEKARPDYLLGELQRYSHDGQKNVMKLNWSGEFVRYEEVQKVVAEATRVIGATVAALEQASSVQERAAAFISQRDPFGDHFSPNDLARLDPAGGYTETAPTR